MHSLRGSGSPHIEALRILPYVNPKKYKNIKVVDEVNLKKIKSKTLT